MSCRSPAPRCAELRLANGNLVFPGSRINQPMSDMTLTKLLREMDLTGMIE